MIRTAFGEVEKNFATSFVDNHPSSEISKNDERLKFIVIHSPMKINRVNGIPRGSYRTKISDCAGSISSIVFFGFRFLRGDFSALISSKVV